MKWYIGHFGFVEEKNGVWIFLQSLMVKREGNAVQISKEGMIIGERAQAVFKSGMGKNNVTVERIS